jgi:DNA-binding IclR family transcriptional regulator
LASLEIAARVLRCFSSGQTQITLTEIASLLDLPMSSLSRLLRQMREVGFLADGQRGHGYRLGALLQELGPRATSETSLRARASAAVRRLCDRLGYTGYVSELRGADVVGVVHHLGHNPLQVGVALGGRLPADACATGRAMLALMTDEEVHLLLAGQVSRATPQSPADVDELLHRLAVVRRQGWAESRDEAGKGVGALAVAVRDDLTSERLSLCMTYPLAVLEKQERALAIEMLLQARHELDPDHP